MRKPMNQAEFELLSGLELYIFFICNNENCRKKNSVKVVNNIYLKIAKVDTGYYNLFCGVPPTNAEKDKGADIKDSSSDEFIKCKINNEYENSIEFNRMMSFYRFSKKTITTYSESVNKIRCTECNKEYYFNNEEDTVAICFENPQLVGKFLDSYDKARNSNIEKYIIEKKGK
jgi:formate-dependent nitrite reductase cytochrome c552 subunit